MKAKLPIKRHYIYIVYVFFRLHCLRVRRRSPCGLRLAFVVVIVVVMVTKVLWSL